MNMKVFACAALLLMSSELFTQSYAFGLKGGLTIGVQQWDGFERDPLFKYHGIAFIESAPEGNQFAIFAQAGYHQKGSAIRNGFFTNPINGNLESAPTQEFIFHNISLVLGGKQKYAFGSGESKLYYLVGLRGEYTAGTNLESYQSTNNFNRAFAIYPFPESVIHWNYGITAGGGMEVPFSEFVCGLLEFTVNPDFSRQYRQPSIPNVRDPFTGESRTIPERIIRNIAFEVTLGLRFLHKIEYID
jgi:hypothetical protein